MSFQRAVENGKITGLSVSAIEKANPAEEGCYLRWWYRYVGMHKEPHRTFNELGDQVQSQLDHYLATGEDVLGNIARAGKKFLPAPGADLFIDWGTNGKKRPPPKNGEKVNWFDPRESQLFAAGIPLVGFMDLLHGRGEYVNEHGVLVPEPGVPELIDHKTTKHFKWSKTEEGIVKATQMRGYGLFILEQEPDAPGVRYSHINYRTEGSPDAIKVTTFVPADVIRNDWKNEVEVVVEKLKSVAGTQSEKHVEGNLDACRNFGGCPHRDYCWAYKNNQPPLERIRMGLIKDRNGASAVPPAAPAAPNGQTPWIQPPGVAPQFAPAPAPQLAAALPPPPAAPASAPQPEWIQAGSATRGKRYIVNGVDTMFLSTAGDQQTFLPIAGGQQIYVPFNTPILPVAEGAPTMMAAPAPVSAPAPAPAAPAPAPQVSASPPGMEWRGGPGGGWVPTGTATAAPQPAPAPAPAVSVLPPPTIGAPPAPTAPATAPAVPAAPAIGAPTAGPTHEAPRRGRRPKLQMQDVPGTAAAPAAAAAPQPAPTAGTNAAFQLYVNAVPNTPFTDLTGYVFEAVKELEAQNNVLDLRVAPDQSPIGYARWRGALAAMVKAQPPPPGLYVAFTKGNEFTEVVVEALSQVCTPGNLVRGIGG